MKRNTLLAVLAATPAVAFITLPLIGLLSKTKYDEVCPLLFCDEVKTALVLTAITSGIAALIIVLIGTPLALVLAYRPFRGKRLVDTIIDLPLVLPPAVAGVALFFTFGREGFISRYHADYFQFPFTPAAVVIAQVFVSAPLYIRQARVGFLSVPTQTILASRTLGASFPRTFFRVILPLASHGLIAGLVLAWARSVGEFGATLMFAGNMQGVTQTMSLAIYSAFEAGGKMASVVIMSAILLVVSFLVIAITRMLLESRDGAQEGGPEIELA